MKNISLFYRRKKITLILGLFTILRVVSAFLFCISGGEFFSLLCDLSACGMITVFFELFSFALEHYFFEGENAAALKYKGLISGLTEGAELSLKLVFLFLPPMAVGSMLGIHIIAAAVDVLCRSLYKLK